MAKQKSTDRKAIAEKLRREQRRKERIRSLSILGACGLVVVVLLGVAVAKYVSDRNAAAKINGLALADVGVSSSAASCNPVVTKNAGGNGTHVNPGTPIKYDTAPPAFGKHWGNFLTGSEIRNFYSRQDRPQLERLVHSLEHGHTILWYDDSVKQGTKAYTQVQQIAQKFSTDAYFMAAPWNSTDGGSFPGGKHVALTHWTGPQKQLGVWEYCSQPSGSITEQFTKTYPAADAPEPGSA